MPAWRRNHSEQMPRNLLFVDTESYRQTVDHSYYDSYLYHRLGVAQYVDWRSKKMRPTKTTYFRTTGTFWETVAEFVRPKQVLWVFAHNILFDLSMLRWGEQLENDNLQLWSFIKPNGGDKDVKKSQRVFKGSFNNTRHSVVFECLYHHRRINFVDTYNYFRTSVSDLGDSLGIAKLIRPADDAGDKEWFAYCERDVDIIRTAICSLLLEWEVNGCGNWQKTIASLAYSSYRHLHMSIPPVPHSVQHVSAFESKAYRDGRTQLFYNGDIREPMSGGSVFGSDNVESGRPWMDGPVYLLDVRQCYPSVMQKNLYPRKCITSVDGVPQIIDKISPGDLRSLITDYLSIATVTINTKLDIYPYQTSDRVIYPVGEFVTTLATPELKMALDLGEVAKVWFCTIYDRAELFTEFVGYWSDRRRHHEDNGNTAFAECAKLIMDGLAGKFAQRQYYWKNLVGQTDPREWQQWPVYDTRIGEVLQYRTIGRNVQVLESDGWVDTAFIAIAAHINSYARLKMLDLMTKAGRSNVLYIGNDSLLVTQQGYDNLNMHGEIADRIMGKLQLKHMAMTARLYGPRDYEIGETVKKAGLPSEREQLAYRHWRFDVFEDTDTLLLRRPDGTVRLHKREIRGGGVGDFLQYGSDGWNLPLVMTRDQCTKKEEK